MKKFRLFLAIILILFSVLVISVLTSHSTENPAWKHSKLIAKLGQGNHYLLELKHASCAIILHDNGHTEVLASDYDWHGLDVCQNIKIAPDGAYEESITSEDRKYPHKKRGRHYKVYIAKCKPHINELPPEVQARLAGL